jgi:multidrug efflux pump subunit AcrA (membrane-fusion protein)
VVVQKVIYSGQVALAHELDLAFRASGHLAKVYVQDGDHVEAGDLIAVLDNSTLEIDLELATLSLAAAKDELARAEEDLTFSRRQAELNLAIAKLNLQKVSQAPSSTTVDTATLAITQFQVELAQMALDRIRDEVSPSVKLGIRRDEVAVQKLKQSILDGQLHAPFNGEVRFIALPKEDEAAAIQANAVVARVVEPGKFKIELNLPKAQLEPLQEGMPVRVSAASLPGVSLPGKIAALPRPFGTSQGSLTEVILTNVADSPKLHEGITVAVSIDLRSKQDALVIPRTALREENQLYYVQVLEGEQQKRVDVAVGIVGDEWVEILSGLQVGQVVVMANNK